MIVLVLGLIAGAAGYLIGDYKRRPVLGAVLGLFLGLIGIAMIAIIPARRSNESRLSAPDAGGRPGLRCRSVDEPRWAWPSRVADIAPRPGRRGRSSGLVDAGAAPHVVSMSSVSGGSIANGVVVASGDLRRASRGDVESWLQPGLRQWAHDGLFFSGPSTASGSPARSATWSPRRRGSSRRWWRRSAHREAGRRRQSCGRRSGSSSRSVLIVGAVAMRMPSGVIGFGMLLGSLLVLPFAFVAITAATASAWWLFAIWAVAIVLLADRAQAVRSAQRDSGRRAREDPLRRAHDEWARRAARSPRVLRYEPAHGQQRVPHEPDGLGRPTHRRAGGRPHPRDRGAGVCVSPGSVSPRTIDVTPGKQGGTVVLDDGGVYDNMADQWEWGSRTASTTRPVTESQTC